MVLCFAGVWADRGGRTLWIPAATANGAVRNIYISPNISKSVLTIFVEAWTSTLFVPSQVS